MAEPEGAGSVGSFQYSDSVRAIHSRKVFGFNITTEAIVGLSSEMSVNIFIYKKAVQMRLEADVLKTTHQLKLNKYAN